MAATTISASETNTVFSTARETRYAHNLAVDDIDALRTKLAAVITAAGTSLAAIAALGAPVAVTTNKVSNQDGGTTRST